MHFGWLDYTLFGIYMIASAGVGALFVKEQHSMKDFFLAGRTMGPVVVAISVMAALFSGISYLGGPAEVYIHGTAFGFMVLSFFIATPLTTVYLLPFFYRARFITAYQYLEERFSLPVRLLASGLFILRVLLWLGSATYAPALALEKATGMPLTTTILLTGSVTVAYTMMGGMKAVIWTDVMQFFVLLGGQLAIVIVAVGHIPGGWSEVWQVASTHGQPLPAPTLDLGTRVSWPGIIIAGALLSLVQMATDQVAVQRYMTARDLKTARQGLWLKLWVTIPILGIFYFTGAVLRAFYNHNPDPLATGAIGKADQILPYFVVHELPHGLPGILIAAIFAASMSTISAGLNSLASATMVDFQQRLSSKPLPPDATQILHARYWTLFYGAIVIALAFLVSHLGNLVESVNTIIGLVGGPLLALFLTGVFVPKISAKTALIGTAVGFACGILSKTSTDISFLWYTTVGCVSTFITSLILSHFFPGRPAAELTGLVWHPSMHSNDEVR